MYVFNWFWIMSNLIYNKIIFQVKFHDFIFSNFCLYSAIIVLLFGFVVASANLFFALCC